MGSPLLTAPRLLVLALLLPCLAACGTFPVRLFVSSETVELLGQSDYAEDTDPEKRERALTALFGAPTPPVPAARGTDLHRHGSAPSGGDSRPAAIRTLNDPDHPHLAGLRPGDLLLAKNAKPQSLGQTLSLADFVYHDHLGLLGLVEGRYVVYESWPKISFLGFSKDFASRFRGGVRRSPLSSYLARYETFEFLRLAPESLGPELLESAERSLVDPAAYDPYHDPEDPRLSCSEYIEGLFCEALGFTPPLRRVPASRNAPLRALMESLGFRTHPYLVPESFADLEGTRVVGVLSRHATSADLRGERLAFRLLHELSEAGAAPGSFLALHPWRLLRYRDGVAAYLAFARGRARITAPARLESELRLALPFFLRRRS